MHPYRTLIKRSPVIPDLPSVITNNFFAFYDVNFNYLSSPDRIQDLTGNGRHIVLPSPNDFVINTTNNGRYYWDGDGLEDRGAFNSGNVHSVAYNGTSPNRHFTMVALISQKDMTASSIYFQFSGTVSITIGKIVWDEQIYFRINKGVNEKFLYFDMSADQMYLVMLQGDASNFSLYVNNVLIDSVSIFPAIFDGTLTTISFGGFSGTGGSGGIPNTEDGHNQVCGGFCRGYQLTAADRTSIYNYYKTRYVI